MSRDLTSNSTPNFGNLEDEQGINRGKGRSKELGTDGFRIFYCHSSEKVEHKNRARKLESRVLHLSFLIVRFNNTSCTFYDLAKK